MSPEKATTAAKWTRRKSLWLVHFDFSPKRTCPHSCGVHEMFSALQYPVCPARCCQKDAPDWMPGVKRQQQGQQQVEKPLFVYVVMRLMPSSDLVQMSRLCGDLCRPSWCQYHLFGIDSISGRLLSVPLVIIGTPFIHLWLHCLEWNGCISHRNYLTPLRSAEDESSTVRFRVHYLSHYANEAASTIEVQR
ncbi:hypothetical protein TNCV_4732161 [Trichonephila clavipes]|nr:hypothetical protein TNCV_4732161 [Trichonephila clavipes]